MLVEIDENGLRKPDSSGDCYPACIASIFEIPLELAPGMNGNSQKVWDWLALNYPGIGMTVRDWHEPRDHVRNDGFWIATVISPRFREPDCHHCTTDRRRKSKPEHGFYRRDECVDCGGTGHGRGFHAVVMEYGRLAWDPHPKADWDTPLQIVGETLFTVTDPARLAVRTIPRALAA